MMDYPNYQSWEHRESIPSDPNGTTCSTSTYLYFFKDKAQFNHEKPYSIFEHPDIPGDQCSNITLEPRNVADILEDARPSKDNFDIHLNSFCFLRHKSKIPVDTEEKMMVPYAKEVNSLLRSLFDSQDVICYDLRVSELCST